MTTYIQRPDSLAIKVFGRLQFSLRVLVFCAREDDPQ